MDKMYYFCRKVNDMIKVGDRVKFLNDAGGGIVTGFVGKNMVNVENEDGFEVPYPVSQLLNVDDPALNRGEVAAIKPAVNVVPPPQKEEKSKGKVLTGKDSPDFYFCIVPFDSKNPLGGDIDLFLVNDSNFTVLYHYGHFKNDTYFSVMHGAVQPNSREELETIDMNDLAELPEYSFQLIYFRNEEKDWHPGISKKFKVNPVKFYKEKSFQPNSLFKKNALVYQITENILNTEIDKLTEDDFRKVVKAKEKPVTEVQLPKPKETEIVEVDLHIHQLIDNSAGLTNKEILEIQLDKVEREMRTAIQNRAKRIVFIHGVGQGVLKQEIAKRLKSKFPRYIYQDASFREYGYGATMVIIRKK
jgi:hypothetical protein